MIHLDQSDIPRDRWHRPILDGVTYTRASTLAKALDDQTALIRWASRQTAIGLATADDLIAAVATTDPTDKTTLDKLVDQAKERAATGRGATLGTAIHAATEAADRGQTLTRLPATIRADVEAYRTTIDAAGLTPLAAELFVACPDILTAGTFDRIYAGPHRVVIGDVKTSASRDSAKYAGLAWSIQLAAYAHGRPWIPGTGLVDWPDVGLPEPDQSRGLIVHVVQGEAEVRLYSIDLDAGWRAAQLAAEVLNLRKSKSITTEVPNPQNREHK